MFFSGDCQYFFQFFWFQFKYLKNEINSFMFFLMQIIDFDQTNGFYMQIIAIIEKIRAKDHVFLIL